MHKKLFFHFAAVCLLSVCFVGCDLSSATDNEISAATESVPAADLIGQGEELYRRREDLGKLRAGLALVKRARNSDPNNFEANWKLAKFNYYLGDKSTDDKEREKAFKEGIDAGRTASRIAPERPDGYFWTGANLGGRAKKNPITDGLGSIGEIRQVMNKVIEIQPDYQGATAYDVLAQVELGTRMTGGQCGKISRILGKSLCVRTGKLEHSCSFGGDLSGVETSGRSEKTT